MRAPPPYLLPPSALSECRRCGLACLSITVAFLCVFNGTGSKKFTFSPWCRSGLKVAVDIGGGRTGENVQWPEFSVKFWRILAWQRLSPDLCSLPQPSSAKKNKPDRRGSFISQQWPF